MNFQFDITTFYRHVSIPNYSKMWHALGGAIHHGRPFYPHTIDNSGWLKYYSHIFDYVEIDSSFYRIPSPSWPRIGPKEVVRISDSQPNFLKSSLMIKD
jgi:dihydrodipicolinate synthase/N-acetylneuraminate lyase